MTEFNENNNFNLTTPNTNEILNSIRNNENIMQNASMIEGENGRYSYATTGNMNLDFFSKLSRNSTKESIIEYFKKAYNEDKTTGNINELS